METFDTNQIGRRMRPEPECPVRTAFQRDVDRVTYSKAFRRLMHKTQVFFKPEGDHYRTRITHTLEVSRIARTMARALGLREDLCEAAALGHDLGHTPFGHAGETVLDELLPHGFRHNEHSLRVVDHLEKLNLTLGVRDAIVCHTGERAPATPEGRMVRFADRIAYINHDIDDAMRAGILTAVPPEITKTLGDSHSRRIDTLVRDIIAHGGAQSEGCAQAMDELRDFMFAEVYRSPVAKREESRAQDILRSLFEYYIAHPGELPPESEEDGIERRAADYIAGMTDRYAVSEFTRLFVPKGWR